MAAKKFYVVWSGKKTGIFETWDACRAQVHGVQGARYKSFPSRAAAEQAFAAGADATLPRRATGARKPAKAPAARVSTRDITIYCDGGADPNPGKAGSGIAVYMGPELLALYYGMYTPRGTNNTAELHALQYALLLAREFLAEGRSVEILADSTYAIKCITQWADGWKKRGWRKKDGEIKNLALIQDIHALYQTLAGQVHIEHVKAHAGTEGNELADRMTMVAVQRRERDFVPYNDEIDIAALLKMRS